MKTYFSATFILTGEVASEFKSDIASLGNRIPLKWANIQPILYYILHTLISFVFIVSGKQFEGIVKANYFEFLFWFIQNGISEGEICLEYSQLLELSYARGSISNPCNMPHDQIPTANVINDKLRSASLICAWMNNLLFTLTALSLKQKFIYLWIISSFLKCYNNANTSFLAPGIFFPVPCL